jgi:hypothetical protein
MRLVASACRNANLVFLLLSIIGSYYTFEGKPIEMRLTKEREES